MKHLTRVSVAKAADDNTVDVQALLSLVFQFVLDMVNLIKGTTPAD